MNGLRRSLCKNNSELYSLLRLSIPVSANYLLNRLVGFTSILFVGHLGRSSFGRLTDQCHWLGYSARPHWRHEHLVWAGMYFPATKLPSDLHILIRHLTICLYVYNCCAQAEGRPCTEVVWQLIVMCSRPNSCSTSSTTHIPQHADSLERVVQLLFENMESTLLCRTVRSS